MVITIPSHSKILSELEKSNKPRIHYNVIEPYEHECVRDPEFPHQCQICYKFLGEVNENARETKRVESNRE